MSNDDVTALKKRRTTILAACTRIRTYVDSVTSINPSIAAQLEERKSKLDSYWSEYDDIQTKIESRDAAEANHRVTFEEPFYSLSAKIRKKLNPAIPTRASASPSPSPSSVASFEHYSHIRLPKLDLPKFSGGYQEWYPFFDTFNALIHSNMSLSNVQKLQYLRASLTGDAAQKIAALEISNVNYEVAWNLLKERYDNKRVIIQGHIKAIMDLPSMTKENLAELRQVADGASRHIYALRALKRPTQHWDDLLVYILSNKLDALTLREWRLSLTSSEMPTLRQFIDFIAHRCQTLEASGKSSVATLKGANTRSQSDSKRQSCFAAIKAKCIFCKGDYPIYHCQNFLALPISQRISEIRKRKACANCLRSTDHSLSKCTSGNCKLCKLKHNTLLHLATAANSNSESHDSTKDGSSEAISANSSAALANNAHSSIHNCIMLSTATVYAYDSKGSRQPCRVLLDAGSQANFISRRFLRVLAFKPQSLDVSVSGINRTTTKASQAVEIRLQSRTNSFNLSLDCIVTDHVTDVFPAFTLKRSVFDIPNNIRLADPQFHVASEIDVLFGAEHFWDLLCIGQIKSPRAHPTLHKTRFGWVLGGRWGTPPGSRASVRSFHASITNAQLHDQLSRFWRVEDVVDLPNNYSDEEARCKQHFLENLFRTEQNRFVVKFPFKEHVPNTFKDSRTIALKRFHNLERRLIRDPHLKDQYAQFLSEYQELGYMKLINEQADDDAASFYLPHHCVFKSSATGSKIRVVFDASTKCASGKSLNDTLMVGPVVQQELFSILLRFRTFRFALAADIIKMYRQVLIHPSQTCYQRIL
ncbi:uncharacterized protein [Linepithema humile]|uniref:uncharacterized protein n=1 Tax=Linepithema humile TaxID=83485 RepID=UPI00351E2F09